MMRWVLAGACVCALGCATTTSAPSEFTIGGPNDPVLKLALSSGSTTSTLSITISNSSNKDYTEGIITLAPLFVAGQAPSTALSNYVSSSSSSRGDVSKLITAAGLTLNVNAFKVPAIDKGKSVTVAITVPTGSALYFIARLRSGNADFAAIDHLELGGTIVHYEIKGGAVSGSTTTSQGSGTTVDLSACSGSAAMTQITTLFDDEMALAPYDAKWPMSAGYDAEFNGEWFTDGVSARVANAGSGQPLGAVTGFVKFLSICPTAGAKISLEADVDTAQYSAKNSDTTLHVYYFDASNNVLKIDYGYPLHKGSLRRIALYDSDVPSNARRIGLVPMARFDAVETSTVFYQNLRAVYEPRGALTETTLASDDFSSYVAASKQPTGWAEFNGDWYVIPANLFATLWNSSWGGDQSKLPPVDTGMTKSFSLASAQAGDTLSAKLFSASTFTDPTSFVRLRFLFSTGAAIDSDRTGGSTYNELYLRRVAIPAGATSVTVVVNVYLGAKETSSLYVDDLLLTLTR